MIAYTDYAIDARVRREAETLTRHGFQVLCITPRTGLPPTRSIQNGVQLRELDTPKYRGKSTLAYVGSYLRFLHAASVACLRLLAGGKLDVVHVHNVPDFLVLAGLLPRLSGTKVILDIHDSMPETFAAKFSSRSIVSTALRLEERLSALVADRVICVNHPQRDALVRRGIPFPKTFVSMNVADPAIFTRRSAIDPARVDGERFNLVYHGTMAKRLGVDLIVRAVAHLRPRIPGLRLHLWGRGDDLDELQRLTGELGVGDLVQFNPKGYAVPELPERLSGMELGLVGNRRGAAADLMLPVKLLEYVALGIPAVVPRLKTIEHYFADDMVGYYEAENVTSMAAAIERLHRDPAARQRQSERAGQFLAEYGWERQGPELVALYRQLLER